MLGALKFNSAKCETTCRLCLGRIKLLKNKRNQLVANYRKEIAELLKTGKQDYARIRVEAVIRESLTLQAYEILELFMELLAVRAPLVASSKEIPRDMVEALSSVLYCASRVPDLPELLTLHKMFAQKYGKEYVQEASSDAQCHKWNVNEKLRRCVTVEPPEPSLKLETLSEIAQDFKVEWDMDRARREMLPADTPGSAGAVPGVVMPGPAPRDPPPPGSPYSGGGGGGMSYGMQMQPLPVKPAPPSGRPGSYQDAQQAAAAAAAAAAEAQRAAEYAKHLADGTGAPVLRATGSGTFGGGSGGSGVAAPASPMAGGGGGGASGGSSFLGPPPQGWLSSFGPPPQRPVGPPVGGAGVGAAGAGAGVAASAASTSSAPGDFAGFRPQSNEEIQKAYDSAQGPPVKVHTLDGGNGFGEAAPPAAPAAPPPPAAPQDEDGAGDLPSAPKAGAGRFGGGAAAGGEVDGEVDELTELQRRFDALKRH